MDTENRRALGSAAFAYFGEMRGGEEALALRHAALEKQRLIP